MIAHSLPRLGAEASSSPWFRHPAQDTARARGTACPTPSYSSSRRGAPPLTCIVVRLAAAACSEQCGSVGHAHVLIMGRTEFLVTPSNQVRTARDALRNKQWHVVLSAASPAPSLLIAQSKSSTRAISCVSWLV